MCEQVLRVKTLRTKGLDSPTLEDRGQRARARNRRNSSRRTLPRDHARNLNDRIDLRLWENTFPSSALDIKR